MDKTFIRIFVSVFGLVGLGLLTGAYFALSSEISFRADHLPRRERLWTWNQPRAARVEPCIDRWSSSWIVMTVSIA